MEQGRGTVLATLVRGEYNSNTQTDRRERAISKRHDNTDGCVKWRWSDEKNRWEWMERGKWVSRPAHPLLLR